MIKLGIIEDTVEIREVLVAYFNNLDQYEVLYDSYNAEEFFKKACLVDLDVIICDIGLPRMSGVEACWIIKQQCQDVHVLMYTVFENDKYLFEALKAGASGYMLKQDNLEVLESAVKEVAAGGGVMGSQIAKKVMNYFSKEKPLTPSEEYELTKRELEVASYLVKGLVVKDVRLQRMYTS